MTTSGVGSETALLTKGWLPYTLRWTLRIVEPITDAGYALTATGDLVGAGRWTFVQDGPEVVITYDWRVSASKPLLRRLTWLLRPVFSANHRWAMARGEESLRLELRRRRATTEAERRRVPPPPAATFLWLVPARRYRTVETACQCRNFRPTTPPTIATRHSSRAAVAGSPSATIP